MLPVVSNHWADQLWVRLHCLKERLSERAIQLMVDESLAKLPPSSRQNLVEGRDPDSAISRGKKLQGTLLWRDMGSLAGPGGAVATEVRQIVAEGIFKTEDHMHGSPLQVLQARGWRHGAEHMEPFSVLQSLIIEQCFVPDRLRCPLEIVAHWAERGVPFDGQVFPHARVSEFAADFSLWISGAAEGLPDAITLTASADDVVKNSVEALVRKANDRSCPKTQEYICLYLGELSQDARPSAFAWFLRAVGPVDPPREGGPTLGQRAERVVALAAAKLGTQLGACLVALAREVLTRPLAVVGSKRDLPSASTSAAWEEMIWEGPGGSGVHKGVAVDELVFVASSFVLGMEHVRLAWQSAGDTLEGALDCEAVRSAFATVMLTLAVVEPEQAYPILRAARASSMFSAPGSSAAAASLRGVEWYLATAELQKEWTKADGLRKMHCPQGVPRDLPDHQAVALQVKASEYEKLQRLSHSKFVEGVEHIQSGLLEKEFLPDDTTLTITPSATANLRRTCAWRLVLAGLSAYHLAGDLRHCLSEFAPSLAMSPWLLPCIGSELSFQLLMRLRDIALDAQPLLDT